jgi:hypothetical protein
MFKRYAFDTSRNLKNLWKSNKTPQDKAALLAKLVALNGAAGELIGDTTTAIKTAASNVTDPTKIPDKVVQAVKDRGKPDETPNDLQKEISKFYKKGNINEQMVNRLLDDIGGSFTLGLIGQLGGDATDPMGQRLMSTVAGPAISDAVGVVKGAYNSATQFDWRPGLQALIRQLTPLGYSTSKNFDKDKKKKAPMGFDMSPSMPKVKPFSFD